MCHLEDKTGSVTLVACLVGGAVFARKERPQWQVTVSRSLSDVKVTGESQGLSRAKALR